MITMGKSIRDCSIATVKCLSEKRPDEQRYDDLDESAMDNTRQTDGYEEPIRKFHHEKTCLRGFRSGPTQTGLCNHKL